MTLHIRERMIEKEVGNGGKCEMYINDDGKIENCILNVIEVFAKEMVGLKKGVTSKLKVGWDSEIMGELETDRMIMIA